MAIREATSHHRETPVFAGPGEVGLKLGGNDVEDEFRANLPSGNAAELN